MASETVVRARINAQVKERAAKVLADMGLSVSDAIRLLLVRVAADKTLPFEIEAPNAETRAAMAEVEQGSGKSFDSVAELMADWRGRPRLRHDVRLYSIVFRDTAHRCGDSRKRHGRSFLWRDAQRGGRQYLPYYLRASSPSLLVPVGRGRDGGRSARAACCWSGCSARTVRSCGEASALMSSSTPSIRCTTDSGNCAAGGPVVGSFVSRGTRRGRDGT